LTGIGKPGQHQICGYGAGEETITWSYVLPGVVSVAVDSRGHPTAVLENQVPLS